MPQLAVREVTGEKVGQVEASEAVFGLPLNMDLIHQALHVLEAKRHHGTHKVQVRSDVSLTKAKWFRQKGLGRARHGSRSAAQFVGGYKAHGPHGDKRRVSLPKKMIRKALLSALSEQVRDGLVSVVAGLQVSKVSTGFVAEALHNLGVSGRTVLILAPDEYREPMLHLSCRNIPHLVRREVPHMSVRDVLWASHILISTAGVEAMNALATPSGASSQNEVPEGGE
jgi:large subunit ribosomal protein L4